MNPARSTGPALATLQLADLWLYWLAPLLGSTLAVAITAYVHGTKSSDGESAKVAQGERR
jgi:glycerol uptake facilitator-like aquaporin